MELWYTRVEGPGAEFRIKIKRPLFSSERGSRRIDILESEELGRIILVDGNIILVEADAVAYREMVVHVPLNAQPEARRALIVGGGDGNLLTELVRYQEIESITIVEPDSSLVDTVRRFFPENGAAFDDHRSLLVQEEAGTYIRETRERYDLIFVESSTLGDHGAELDQAFFCDAFRVLAGDGALVHRAGSAFFPHQRRELVRAIGRIKRLFPLYRVYRINLPSSETGCLLLGYASKRFDPLGDLDEEGWRRRGLATRYYNPAFHRAAFVLPQELKETVEKA